MASTKFKPKASTNIIEGATPVEEMEEKVTPSVEETEQTNTPEEGVVNTTEQETPAQETSTEETKTEEPKVEEPKAPVKEDSEEKKSTTPQTVTFEDKKSTPAEKNVKICLRAKHSCTIGGVHYHFEKGKQYNVPQSVKSILMQADLLMPL